jgi:DNA-binding HxlR family transcriptional regulator
MSSYPNRRSICPVSCALDIFGDKWSLLIIRDLLLGRTRYKEFAASPEAIPTNILAERLRRLLAAEIIEQEPARDGTQRLGYVLTGKGKALKPIVRAMKEWGLTWEPGTQAKRKKLAS